MSRDWLLVSETFKSIQGEGPSAGQAAFFVRLGACNLHCRWCDTPYTWAFSKRLAELSEHGKQYDASRELYRIPLVDIGCRILEAGPKLIVITGGEPLLQWPAILSLVSSLRDDLQYEIETAGTVDPDALAHFPNVRFNVSPKLESSGNELETRYRPDVLRILNEYARSVFKFVVDTRPGHFADADRDLIEIRRIITDVGIPRDKVWLMPCGTTSQEIDNGLKTLGNLAVDAGYNLTSRMHVTIWGDKRGH